jgi:excisionase family DNA binding protein
MIARDADVETLVDAAVVARALDISVEMVRRLVRRGQLPAVAVGSRLMRFDMAAVLRSLPARSGVVDVSA